MTTIPANSSRLTLPDAPPAPPAPRHPASAANATTIAATHVRCTHCRQSVPKGLIRPDQEQQFCCAGCSTAYQAIHACGLDKFYQLLEASQAASRPAKVTSRSYTEYDDAVFRQLYVKGSAGGVCSVDLLLQNIHCSACLWLIERLPGMVPGVLEARVNMRRAMVTLTWNDGAVPLSRIAKALDSIGYPPHPARDVRARERQAQAVSQQ